MSNIHVCEWLTNFDVSKALDIKVECNESNWQLHYRAYASEYDVKIGEADVNGELLSDIGIVIQYCPFCGQKLK